MGWTKLKLNKKYADWIMNTADAEINISEGSVRSGKTTAMILAFCMYLETMTYEGLHVAAAENLANA